MTTPNALFVYGTLAPGEENHHQMDGMVGIWVSASVRGKLVQTGWGAHKGHPGLVPNDNGDIVEGVLFISDDLPKHWDRLDTFEGADYKRVSIMASLKSGETMQAEIYSVIA